MANNLNGLDKLNKNCESSINENKKYILLDDINDIIIIQNNNIEIKFDNIKNKIKNSQLAKTFFWCVQKIGAVKIFYGANKLFYGRHYCTKKK